MTWRVPHSPPTEPFTLNTESPQAQGLVAWWPSLGSAGANVLRDFGGRGLNGAFLGDTANPTWVGDGQFGNVLRIGGVNDYVQVPDLPSLRMGDVDFTITVWVNMAALPATYRGVLTKWADSSSDAEYAIYSFPNGNFDFSVRDSSNNLKDLEATSFGAPPLNAWHLIAAWHDSVANTVNIQIDAGTVNLAAWATGVRSGTRPLRIGADQVPTSINGRVADVRIYNRVLSAAEVWQQWAPQTRWDLYRPLRQRYWIVPGIAGRVGIYGRQAALRLPGGVSIRSVGGEL